MSDEWEKSQEIRINGLRAQVAERDAMIERYAMESVAKDMRIESLTASLEDMRNRWKDAEQDWMQLRAEIAERDATIAELRAQVAKRDKLIAQFRADIANRDEELARLNSVFSVMKYGVAQ